MNVEFLVILGKTIKRRVPLRLPAVLGRSRSADITVTHPLISRRHCEIYADNGLLMVRDLTSLNGTMVGGRHIKSAPLLPNGEFTIGSLTFRVVYEYNGKLESVPAPRYLDEAAVTARPELRDEPADVVEARSRSDVDAALPPSSADLSDSGEMAVPNFMELADANPEAVFPPLPAAPIAQAGPRLPSAGFHNQPTRPLASAMDEPLEVDSSLQSGCHRKESPWAGGPPLVMRPLGALDDSAGKALRALPEAISAAKAKPSARQEPPTEMPPSSQKPSAPQTPRASEEPPANPPQKPSYSEEIDPEFGSFLDGLG
jgi:predicted component of type VI protein secretion system